MHLKELGMCATGICNASFTNSFNMMRYRLFLRMSVVVFSSLDPPSGGQRGNNDYRDEIFSLICLLLIILYKPKVLH